MAGDQNILDAREAEFLSRVGRYPPVLIFGYLAALVLMWAAPMGGVVPLPDYAAFHAAAEFAAEGRLAEAYDPAAMRAAQAAVTHDAFFAPWYYPPSYVLGISWLAYVPYYMGAALFLALSFGLFAFAMRPWMNDRTDWMLFMAAPVLFVTLAGGQNGPLTAALAVLAFRALPERPASAGFWLGLLTIKPHLGLLAPIYLIAARQWRTIAVAALVASALAATAYAAYGAAPWLAFLKTVLGGAGADINDGRLPIAQNSGPFATLRLLGVPTPLALSLHVAIAIAICVALVRLIRRGTPPMFLMAFLMTAALVVSPHNFPYDWTFVLVTCAILWSTGKTSGFLPMEKPALIAGYAAPALIVAFSPLGLPLGLPLIALPLIAAHRRARHETERQSTAVTG